MNILGFIIGVGVGAAGTLVVKGKGTSSEAESLKRQLTEILSENEKLHHRNKECERLIEDLKAQLEKEQRYSKVNASDREDMQDDLDDALSKIKKLTRENAELVRKIEEYKVVLASNSPQK